MGRVQSVSMWIVGATLGMKVLTQGSVTYSRIYLLMEMESGRTLEKMSEKKNNPLGWRSLVTAAGWGWDRQ